MSKYVVTGGAGFIGSALVRKLLAEGAGRVVVVDNLLTGREENLAEVRESVDLIKADIRDYDAVAEAVRGAGVVYHLAAIPSVPRSISDPVPSHTVNIDGSFNVFRAASDGLCTPRRLPLTATPRWRRKWRPWRRGRNPPTPRRS
jgi:UDP-glucose 4-epimerase